MTKPVLGGLAVVLMFGFAAASVYGAPPSVRPVQPSPGPAIPTAKIAVPGPPPRAEIACPMTVDVEHSVKEPNGFRAFSASIRGYSHSICQGSLGMAASDTTKVVSCYYCDRQQTHVVRMDAAYPSGRSHCERLGTSYRFECR